MSERIRVRLAELLAMQKSQELGILVPVRHVSLAALRIFEQLSRHFWYLPQEILVQIINIVNFPRQRALAHKKRREKNPRGIYYDPTPYWNPTRRNSIGIPGIIIQPESMFDTMRRRRRYVHESNRAGNTYYGPGR